MPAKLKRALENDSVSASFAVEKGSAGGSGDASPGSEPKRKRFRGATSEIHAACFDNDLENVIDAHLVSRNN